jgi:hypothetical protein
MIKYREWLEHQRFLNEMPRYIDHEYLDFKPMKDLGMTGLEKTLHNRDTLGFAIKCSNITLEDGSEIEVYKDPITDPGKKSKKGKVTTYFDVIDNEFFVDKIDAKLKERCINVLETVIENGVLIKEYTLTEIRNRVNKQLAGVAFGNL